MFKLKLHWQILIAIILGIIWGFAFPSSVNYISPLGDLFLQALKMLIVPLVLTSIITGVTGISSGSNLGRLGLKTIIYYMGTSLAAILTGLILVNLIKPGIGSNLGFKESIDNLGITNVSLQQTLMNIIPSNIVKSLAEGEMLAIIFFALLFGYFITKSESHSKEFLTNLFSSLFEVMMKMTMFVIKFAPLGVFGIIVKLTVQQSAQGKLFEVLGHLGIYMATVLIGLLLHLFVTLPLMLKFIGKVSPLKHFTALREVILTAFSTSSSNATLPLTIEAVELNCGVSNKISSFTLPLGATINMDGTALYECVAAMFIAQAYGIELSFAQQAIVVFTALLASIGSAGIPMAGLVMMSIVLSAVGLPLEGIGLILAVDRILDMCRTVVNVFSDTCGAVIIASSEGETLKIK
jgi:proton glutamate symport protein